MATAGVAVGERLVRWPNGSSANRFHARKETGAATGASWRCAEPVAGDLNAWLVSEGWALAYRRYSMAYAGEGDQDEGAAGVAGDASLTRRLVNHARPGHVTEGYAAYWTVEPLREPAERIADRIDARRPGGARGGAAGHGSGLGRKHCVEGYLDRGALAPVKGEFVPFGGCCVARLTSRAGATPLVRCACGSSRTSPSAAPEPGATAPPPPLAPPPSPAHARTALFTFLSLSSYPPRVFLSWGSESFTGNLAIDKQISLKVNDS